MEVPTAPRRNCFYVRKTAAHGGRFLKPTLNACVGAPQRAGCVKREQGSENNQRGRGDYEFVSHVRVRPNDPSSAVQLVRCSVSNLHSQSGSSASNYQAASRSSRRVPGNHPNRLIKKAKPAVISGVKGKKE